VSISKEKYQLKSLSNQEVLEKLNNAIVEKMNHLNQVSSTAKLWIQYISYINIVKKRFMRLKE